jgi:hypothetical protein
MRMYLDKLLASATDSIGMLQGAVDNEIQRLMRLKYDRTGLLGLIPCTNYETEAPKGNDPDEVKRTVHILAVLLAEYQLESYKHMTGLYAMDISRWIRLAHSISSEKAILVEQVKHKISQSRGLKMSE